MRAQVSGNTAAATYVWFAGPLLFVPYILLQTGLGYFRVAAMGAGLLGSSKAGTWKVRVPRASRMHACMARTARSIHVRLTSAGLLCCICCAAVAHTRQVTRKFGKGGASARTERHRPYALELCLCAVFLGYATAAVLVARVYVLAAFCIVVAGTLAAISVGDRLF